MQQEGIPDLEISILIVVICNPALPNITSIFKRYFPVLQTSHRCKKVKPRNAYGSLSPTPKNLKDALSEPQYRTTRYMAIHHGTQHDIDTYQQHPLPLPQLTKQLLERHQL
ncbi:hypothetical protein PoB_006976700 [Plakobranchus ocellatus]|uniref:Uncharacterized protein n=1 Tax=Plakobranchus ocellatus TaxID=259542 RepID=A0AAV4DGB1_9GAST|nr:hypothetical protein PoB_006976700 [Plakobranchus ocellatus]